MEGRSLGNYKIVLLQDSAGKLVSMLEIECTTAEAWEIMMQYAIQGSLIEKISVKMGSVIIAWFTEPIVSEGLMKIDGLVFEFDTVKEG
jgi:hypothetical protein